MAEIYLLRHAHSTANQDGVLAGRSDGVYLSQIGRKQRNEILDSLKSMKFVAIYSSPMERCLETVEPLARHLRKKIRTIEELNEMDYGDWSGAKLKTLRSFPLWKKIQQKPSSVKFPNGEDFPSARKRVIKGLNKISLLHPRGKVLVVSHGDIIKIAIQETLSGELDRFQGIVIDPASLSIINWKEKKLIASNSGIVRKRSSRKLSSRSVLGGGSNI